MRYRCPPRYTTGELVLVSGILPERPVTSTVVPSPSYDTCLSIISVRNSGVVVSRGDRPGQLTHPLTPSVRVAISLTRARWTASSPFFSLRLARRRFHCARRWCGRDQTGRMRSHGQLTLLLSGLFRPRSGPVPPPFRCRSCRGFHPRGVPKRRPRGCYSHPSETLHCRSRRCLLNLPFCFPLLYARSPPPPLPGVSSSRNNFLISRRLL